MGNGSAYGARPSFMVAVCSLPVPFGRVMRPHVPVACRRVIRQPGATESLGVGAVPPRRPIYTAEK